MENGEGRDDQKQAWSKTDKESEMRPPDYTEAPDEPRVLEIGDDLEIHENRVVRYSLIRAIGLFTRQSSMTTSHVSLLGF